MTDQLRDWPDLSTPTPTINWPTAQVICTSASTTISSRTLQLSCLQATCPDSASQRSSSGSNRPVNLLVLVSQPSAVSRLDSGQSTTEVMRVTGRSTTSTDCGSRVASSGSWEQWSSRRVDLTWVRPEAAMLLGQEDSHSEAASVGPPAIRRTETDFDDVSAAVVAAVVVVVAAAVVIVVVGVVEGVVVAEAVVLEMVAVAVVGVVVVVSEMSVMALEKAVAAIVPGVVMRAVVLEVVAGAVVLEGVVVMKPIVLEVRSPLKSDRELVVDREVGWAEPEAVLVPASDVTVMSYPFVADAGGGGASFTVVFSYPKMVGLASSELGGAGMVVVLVG